MTINRAWEVGKWQYQLCTYPYRFRPDEFPREDAEKVSDIFSAILVGEAQDLLDDLAPVASAWEWISHDVAQIDEFVLVSFVIRREL